MATLRDIQRRIRSVQSTQKITKAMKLVAASKFRRAQERILAARPYATKMRELLGRPRRTLRRRDPSAARAARYGAQAARDHHGGQGALRRLQLEHPARVAALPARRRGGLGDARRGGQEGPRLLPPPPVHGQDRDAGLLRPAGLFARPGAGGRAHAGLPRRGGRRGPPHVQRVPLGRRPAPGAPAAPADRGRGRDGATRDRRRSTSTSPAPRPSSTRSCRAT